MALGLRLGRCECGPLKHHRMGEAPPWQRPASLLRLHKTPKPSQGRCTKMGASLDPELKNAGIVRSQKHLRQALFEGPYSSATARNSGAIMTRRNETCNDVLIPLRKPHADHPTTHPQKILVRRDALVAVGTRTQALSPVGTRHRPLFRYLG